MLAKASALGRGAVVRLLLDYGADVSVRDTEVHTYIRTYIHRYIHRYKYNKILFHT